MKNRVLNLDSSAESKISTQTLGHFIVFPAVMLLLTACLPQNEALIDDAALQTSVESDTVERTVSALPPVVNTNENGELIYQLEDCQITELQLDMLQQVNAARAQSRACGDEHNEPAEALEWNCTLMEVANQHSTDMAVHNFFNHMGSDGMFVDQRVSTSSYHWRHVGENIAAGQVEVDEVIQDWLDSPGHCSTLMNPIFRDFGFALVKQKNTDYEQYWTQVYANPITQ